MSITKALLIIADRSEEMEAVNTVGVLRRAKIDVTVAGADGGKPVKCSQNIVPMPDTKASEGSKAFVVSGSHGTLVKQTRKHRQGHCGHLSCCPITLKSHKILLDKRLTCYPGVVEKQKEIHPVSEDRVVIDGTLITNQSPGTVFEFGLAVVEKYVGKEQAKTIGDAMLVKNCIKNYQ
ncbi:protein DJ-1alpha-like [Brevipalpus obovatus]|uniref:protein DJ-1alpha-like n=1 Tax=Brevipalpus obovatus TaxID=246614 RepID=UPI003D9F3F2D